MDWHTHSLTHLFAHFLEGAPIVVSFPHFYQADPMYINAVDGLNPNKEEHETYLDLQPVRPPFTTLQIKACFSRSHTL